MSAKDREFFSQDRRRGDHTNVYSLLDAGSRAEHNDASPSATGYGKARQSSARAMSARSGEETLRETQTAQRQGDVCRTDP